MTLAVLPEEGLTENWHLDYRCSLLQILDQIHAPTCRGEVFGLEAVIVPIYNGRSAAKTTGL